MVHLAISTRKALDNEEILLSDAARNGEIKQFQG